MRTSSCKAKGRRLLAEAKELFLRYSSGLEIDDIEVTSSGCTGRDMKLSPAAQKQWPFAIEGKNQEKLNVFKSFEQATTHVKGEEIPVLIYRKNHTEPMISMRLEDFLKFVRTVEYRHASAEDRNH